MKLTKSLMAIGITSAMLMTFSACQQTQRENPLLQESTLPFGAPDFTLIQTSDYLPAFEAAIAETRENIRKITECIRMYCPLRKCFTSFQVNS